MKIYILLDKYQVAEGHCDFVDVFDSADAVLNYIEEHQSDGHKFKILTREFQEPLKSNDTHSVGLSLPYDGGTYTTSPDSTGYRKSVVKCTQESSSGTDSVNSESYDGIRIKSKDLKTE